MTNLEKALEGIYVIKPQDFQELFFFGEKYFLLRYVGKRDLCPDVLLFCERFFHNKVCLRTVRTYREMRELTHSAGNVYARDRKADWSFLDCVERLENFYELHQNKQEGAVDRRKHVIFACYKDSKTVLRYLVRLTKKKKPCRYSYFSRVERLS